MYKMNNQMELLAPAGDSEKIKYALAYGADAVYAGFPKFSLRVRENDFTHESLAAAMELTHKKGKKIYLTLNIYPHNRKLASIEDGLNWIKENKPDGIIISDAGVVDLALQICPDIPLHLSTQANAVNWLSVKFWQKAGISRVILPRELSIEEIREIRDKVPEIELECFVHGSICIAYSGRCLISNYLTHRDSNQGACTNSCRWEYRLHGPLSEDSAYYLEEVNRPGEMMPVDEDEHGTYVMNAKDLCAIEILPELKECGIDSIKIEGRTKSIYYVSIITRAYRQALDAVCQNKKVPESALRDVRSISNRGYIRGFSSRETEENVINLQAAQVESHTYRFCGLVREEAHNGLKRVSIRNRFSTGDQLELISPHGENVFKAGTIRSLDDQPIAMVHGGATDVFMKLPDDSEYSLLRKRL
jgi:putative protease